MSPLLTKRGPVRFRLTQRLASPLVFILLLASALSAATGDVASFFIIAGIVSLSVLLDFVQESRAQSAVDALREQVALRADVCRDGAETQPGQPRAQSVPPGPLLLGHAEDRQQPAIGRAGSRPLEDARETEAYLKQRGHEAVVAPLLTVNFHTGPQIDLAGVQAILATSANGVRALSRRTQRRDLPLFAVGPQTALAARDAGFSIVKSAEGDSLALAKSVPNWASAANGPLLHASGADGEGKLAEIVPLKLDFLDALPKFSNLRLLRIIG
jgi:hypothetical protein